MSGLRKPSTYVGRENEWRYITERMKVGRGRHLMYIYGPGGVGKTAFLNLVAEGYSQGQANCAVIDAIDFDDLTLRLPINFLQRIVSRLTARLDAEGAFERFWAVCQSPQGETGDLENRRLAQEAFVAGVNQIAESCRPVLMVDTLEKAPLWFPRFFAETISAIPNLFVILAGRPESQSIEQQLEQALQGKHFRIRIFSWEGLDISLCEAYLAKTDFDGAAAALIPLGIETTKQFKERIWRLANGIPFQLNLFVSLLRHLESGNPTLNKHIFDLMEQIHNLDAQSLDQDIDLLRQRFQRALITPFVFDYKRSQQPGGLEDRKCLSSRIILLLAHVNHYIAYARGGFDAKVLAELDGLMNEAQVLQALQEIQEHRDTLYTFVKLYRGADDQVSEIGLHDEMVRMLNNFAWLELDPPGLTKPRRKAISEQLVGYYERKCQELIGNPGPGPVSPTTWVEATKKLEGQALLLARAFHGMYINPRQGWNWIYELSERVFRQSYFDTLLYDLVEDYVKVTRIGEAEDTKARMDVWKAGALIARHQLEPEQEKSSPILAQARQLLQGSIDFWKEKYRQDEAEVRKLEAERKAMEESRRRLLTGAPPSSPHIQQMVETFAQQIAAIQEAIQNKEQFKDLQRAYTSLGFAHRLESHWQEAIDNYQKALTYSRWLNDKSNIAEIANNMANVYIYLGKLHQAALYSQVSTLIRARLGEKEKLGHSYRILGKINWRIGNTYECRNYWLRARECYQDSPTDQALLDQEEGYIFYCIGDTHLGQEVRKRIPGFGEHVPPPRCFELLEQAIAGLERSDKRDELSGTYNILSRAYRYDREFEKAEEAAHKALELARLPYRMAEAHLSLCNLYYIQAHEALRKEDRKGASRFIRLVRHHYEKGFPLAQQHTLLDLLSVYHSVMGNVEYLEGQLHPDKTEHYDRAFDHYLEECLWAARNRPLRFAQTLNEAVTQRLARLPSNLAQKYATVLKNEQAWIEAGLEEEYSTLESEINEVLRFMGMPRPEEIQDMYRQFDRWMSTGKYKEALQVIQPILERFQRLSWSADTVEVLLKTAQAYRKLTQYTEARRYCKYALMIADQMLQQTGAEGKATARNLDLIRLKAHADFTMGRIMWEIGNTAEAASHFTEALKAYVEYREHPDEKIRSEMQEGLARAVQYEGFMRFRIREFDQALKFLDWAEAEYRRMDNRRRVVKVLNIKARIYHDRNEPGDLERARQALAESLEILAELKKKGIIDHYAEAECYLTHMILEYQQNSRSTDPAQRKACLEKVEEWYRKGVHIAHDNRYTLLQAVYEGVLGNVLFDRAMLSAKAGREANIRPAFDQYLKECYYDSFYEKRRFFRSLDFLMRRLSRLSSEEIKDYAKYIREQWLKLARDGLQATLDSVEQTQGGVRAEYIEEMNDFCNLVEDFSEYIAQS